MTHVSTEALRALTAATVLPGEDGWDHARSPWNVAVDQRPLAVAVPASASEVVDVVRFARDHGLALAPQSTGHGALPRDDLEGAILVRTSGMEGVELDLAARRARAEAGVRWEQVIAPASPSGLTALHGSSPSVGVVGYTLGGGVGWIARKHGLACNAVTAVEVVTAEGELVRAGAEAEPDLFWALRGGGGNFGIVTGIEFALVPVEEIHAGWLVWPWERSLEVLSRWSRWTETVPDEVTSVGRILQLPPLLEIPAPLRGRRLVVVEAAVLGGEDEAAELLRPLRELGPELDTFQALPPIGLCRLHQDPETPTPFSGEHGLLAALPDAAVEAFVAAAGPGSGSPCVSAEIRQLGGALASPAPGAGALSHLEGSFLWLTLGVLTGPGAAAAVGEHGRRVADALAPWGAGGYLNFGLSHFDTSTAFGADAYRRLQAVRRRFDAGGVVRANHVIA